MSTVNYKIGDLKLGRFIGKKKQLDRREYEYTYPRVPICRF
jgi:hypothetical protein